VHKKQWNNITKNYKYSKAMEQGKNIFDDYAKNYQETMGECLKVTGYDSSYFTMTKIKKLRALNLENILKPIRILDFGCGVGNFSVGFKKYFPDSIYVGVDASSGMIREALNKYSEYGEFYEASSSEWGEKKYDIIFSSGTFHHILNDEHENILKKLVSVLTSFGKIFIMAPRFLKHSSLISRRFFAGTLSIPNLMH
jgi:trans-aconitate methyltransferase